ncbi:MAG: helix-turn-helix domain-containing protein [Alphaproteobacteria bacterium]|nr:helix-turn-helix domain-containing protein [Alphaproteobacteria bacterium]
MHVYAIEAPHGVKVGVSGNPTARIRAIQSQGGFKVSRVWMTPSINNAYGVELRAHDAMASVRTVGEWFSESFDTAVNAVVSAIDQIKLIDPDQPVIKSLPDESTLGGRLAVALSRAGMSQRKLAQQIGVSDGAVSHWMSGRYEMSISQYKRVASELGVSPGWLAFGPEN